MAVPAESKFPDAPSPSVPRVVTARHYDEDMDDTTDLAGYEDLIDQGNVHLVPLHRVMRIVQDAIQEPFRKFDQEAVGMRKRYIRTSVTAVASGALAVFAAVAEVTLQTIESAKHTRPIPVLTPLEGIAVAATLGAIAFGYFYDYKERWILARFKAERLRLLKFESLISPKLWCAPANSPAATDYITSAIKKIQDLDYDDAVRWAKRGVHPYAAEPPCQAEHARALDEFLDYYVPKRIGAQLSYMETHWDKLEHTARRTAGAVRGIYWGSFIFVACHLLLQYLIEHHHIPENDIFGADMAAVFAFAALFIPIIAAAIRTYRAANEFERSVLRHKATYDSLNWIADEISHQNDRNRKFTLVGFAEIVLEADCREFLRLLTEAEWYG